MTETVYHLVCGGTGAGKTTYARRLAQETGGVRFTLDEWMTTLFADDAPVPLELAWAVARVARCEAQIRSLAAALAERGVPSVLDLGFATREQRGAWAAAAAAGGARVRLHLLVAVPDERWRRVQQRNTSRGDTYALHVDRRAFDFFEGVWQDPSPEELTALDGRLVP